jgi:hypothetical protein
LITLSAGTHVDDADLLIEDAIERRLGDHGADVGVSHVGRGARRGWLRRSHRSGEEHRRENRQHAFSHECPLSSPTIR